MPFMKSMRPGAGVPDIYKPHSKIYLHWLRMGDEVMSREGSISLGDRELIATYVSSLNGCAYCRTAHLPSMKLHGIERAVVDALVADIETAPIEQRWKPLFKFIKKLTLYPSELNQADADDVFDAGWDEDALHLAIGVTCRFSFMNRLVMGFGLEPPEAHAAQETAAKRHLLGYASREGELVRDQSDLDVSPS